MIMEAVKRNVCRGVIFLMACLTCVVVFASGLIAWADNYSSYVPYTTYACDLGINVTKTLTGREFQAGDEFTFKIEPQNEKYNEVSSKTVTIGAMNNGEDPILPGNTAEADDGAIFIKFTWPGEYVYCISEDEPDEGTLPGIIYDQTKYKVTVTVGVKEDTGNETGGEGAPSGETDASANGESNAPATAGSEGEGDPVVDPSDPVENNITPADGGEENGPSGDGDNQSGGDDAQSKESVQKELEVTNVKVEKRSSSNGKCTVVYDGPPLKDEQYCAFTNAWEGPDDPGDYPETPPEEPDEPDEPDTPEDPVTPDEPDVPDTPDTPDEPNTPNEPTLPQTGQNWRLVWILVITGAVLVLVGILGKKGYHGKHEA